MNRASSPISFHYVIELIKVGQHALGDQAWVHYFGAELSRALGLNAVNAMVHNFGPGITCVLVLAESHIAIHTWPERDYMHIDMLTCGGANVSEAALRSAITAEGLHVHSLARIEYRPLDDQGSIL